MAPLGIGQSIWKAEAAHEPKRFPSTAEHTAGLSAPKAASLGQAQVASPGSQRLEGEHTHPSPQRSPLLDAFTDDTKDLVLIIALLVVAASLLALVIGCICGLRQLESDPRKQRSRRGRREYRRAPDMEWEAEEDDDFAP